MYKTITNLIEILVENRMNTEAYIYEYVGTPRIRVTFEHLYLDIVHIFILSEDEDYVQKLLEHIVEYSFKIEREERRK